MTAFFRKPVGWLVAGVIIALVAWFAWSTFAGQRQRVKQAGQDVRSAEALAGTAQDAASTVIARAGSDASVDALVAATKLEIDNAPDDKAAGDAARAAICRLPNYRNDPACKL